MDRREIERFFMVTAVLAFVMASAACRGPGDDVEDADVVADADVLPEGDADPGDGDATDADVVADADVVEDADVLPDGDVEEEQDPREVLALCLAENGAVLYGAYWCSACRYQKYQFAPYHELINYVDCYFDPELGILSDLKEECQAVDLVEEDGSVHGIEAFPTWTFDGNPHHNFWVGTATFEILAEMSGCEWLGEPTEDSGG